MIAVLPFAITIAIGAKHRVVALHRVLDTTRRREGSSEPSYSQIKGSPSNKSAGNEQLIQINVAKFTNAGSRPVRGTPQIDARDQSGNQRNCPITHYPYHAEW